MAASLQLSAEFGGAVEFPVHDRDDRPVLVLNRLSARLGGVDDREALVPEAYTLPSPDAADLGTAMSKGVKLTAERVQPNRPIGILEEARKTAHGI
jgi:hypothetical protein